VQGQQWPPRKSCSSDTWTVTVLPSGKRRVSVWVIADHLPRRFYGHYTTRALEFLLRQD